MEEKRDGHSGAMARMWSAGTAAALSLACSYGCSSDRLDEKNIDRTIEALTLDEKIRLLVGTCKDQPNPPAPAPGTGSNWVTAGNGGVNTSSSAGKVPGSAGESFAIERLGIPSMVYADGPAGLRIDPERADAPEKDYHCTAFPSATLMAATWDTGLAEKTGQAIGEEVHEHGVDMILAPGMNIKRNPLTGRNFEYYSEDPFLSGKMAAATVRGIQSQGVGACIKHFAANNQETFRNGINVIVSERALREIYLRGFEIAVKESSPWAVMSSYNRINGTYASEDKRLLDDILRGEWGFDGIVMTDWWGADDPVAQMQARNNLLMPGTESQIEIIRKAVQEGRLSEEILDRNLRDLFHVMVKSPSFKKYRYSDAPDLKAHAELSRQAASEGMVLLENKGMLPLEGNIRIALFGNSSYDTQTGGSGSGYVHKKYKVNIAQGLEDAGYAVDQDLAQMYSRHISDEKSRMQPESFWTIPVAPEMDLDDESISKAADKADAAIFTIGRMSGEGADRNPTKGDYYLSDLETELIGKICNAFHSKGKKVAVIVNAGDAIDFSGWNRLPDAILMAWLPGQEGGHAAADIISGRTNPSGRLPMTLARNYSDIPSSADFGVSEGHTDAVVYEEDLMVGYRYNDTFAVEPEYPFGYGLSYTKFSYSDLSVSAPDSEGTVTVSVKVRNTGEYAGKETVMIYVGKPAVSEGRPVRELCGFAKTGILAPGEETAVEIPVTQDALRQWDGKARNWTTAEGEYTFSAGCSGLKTSISLM